MKTRMENIQVPFLTFGKIEKSRAFEGGESQKSFFRKKRERDNGTCMRFL